MKYIKAIEDSSMWKAHYEDTLKGNSKMDDGYYVLNDQIGKGESSQYIPPVAQDIMMAKAKLKRYKKAPKRLGKHSKPKLGRRRKVKSKRKTKSKITRKRRTKKKR